MRPSRLEGLAIAAMSFLRGWWCEAPAVFSMDVTVDGVKELSVFTVISRPILMLANAGRDLDFCARAAPLVSGGGISPSLHHGACTAQANRD
jgi:hypothetical protein